MRCHTDAVVIDGRSHLAQPRLSAQQVLLEQVVPSSAPVPRDQVGHRVHGLVQRQYRLCQHRQLFIKLVKPPTVAMAPSYSDASVNCAWLSKFCSDKRWPAAPPSSSSSQVSCPQPHLTFMQALYAPAAHHQAATRGHGLVQQRQPCLLTRQVLLEQAAPGGSLLLKIKRGIVPPASSSSNVDVGSVGILSPSCSTRSSLPRLRPTTARPSTVPGSPSSS